MAKPTTVDRNVSTFCYAGAWVAPVPVLVFAADRVVFANAAALRRVGCSDCSALIGSAIDRVVHPDALLSELLRREIVARTDKSLLGMPTKLLSCTGSPRHEIADIIPISAAGSALTLFALEGDGPDAPDSPIPQPDIGSIGPELGEAILEALSMPVVIQDVDTILFANAAARGHLGAADRSQIEGRPIASIVHSDGLLAAIERIEFVFATRQRLRGVPVKMRTLDGRTLHANADAYPVSAGGRTAAMLVGHRVP